MNDEQNIIIYTTIDGKQYDALMADEEDLKQLDMVEDEVKNRNK